MRDGTHSFNGSRVEEDGGDVNGLADWRAWDKGGGHAGRAMREVGFMRRLRLRIMPCSGREVGFVREGGEPGGWRRSRAAAGRVGAQGVGPRRKRNGRS